MAFHTPHGSARFRLPWSWSASTTASSATRCGSSADARFETAKVDGRDGRHGPHRPRRPHRAADRRRARLAARARPGANVQPPDAPICARPGGPPARRRRPTSTSGSTAASIRHGYAWSVPADGEQRVGVGSYEPRDHVKEPTEDDRAAGSTATPSATRATGSRTSCAPPPRTACSSSATAPATASRSRARASAPRSTSASPRARDARRCSTASRRASRRSRATRAFRARHAPRLPARAARCSALIPRAAAARADRGLEGRGSLSARARRPSPGNLESGAHPAFASAHGERRADGHEVGEGGRGRRCAAGYSRARCVRRQLRHVRAVDADVAPRRPVVSVRRARARAKGEWPVLGAA